LGNSEKEYYTSSSENIPSTGKGSCASWARGRRGLSCYYGPCLTPPPDHDARQDGGVTSGSRRGAHQAGRGQGLCPLLDVGQATSARSGGRRRRVRHHGEQRQRLAAYQLRGARARVLGNTPFVHVRPLAHGTIASESTRSPWNGIRCTIRYSWTTASLRGVAQRRAAYGNWSSIKPSFVIFESAIGGHFDGDPQSDAIFRTMLVATCGSTEGRIDHATTRLCGNPSGPRPQAAGLVAPYRGGWPSAGRARAHRPGRVYSVRKTMARDRVDARSIRTSDTPRSSCSGPSTILIATAAASGPPRSRTRGLRARRRTFDPNECSWGGNGSLSPPRRCSVTTTSSCRLRLRSQP